MLQIIVMKRSDLESTSTNIPKFMLVVDNILMDNQTSLLVCHKFY